jgi:hypothetical protein
MLRARGCSAGCAKPSAAEYVVRTVTRGPASSGGARKTGSRAEPDDVRAYRQIVLNTF